MRSNTLNNRYRLDKKIGEGGFAHVFLATDLLLGRQVAVKVMEESQIKDKELLARNRVRLPLMRSGSTLIRLAPPWIMLTSVVSFIVISSQAIC